MQYPGFGSVDHKVAGTKGSQVLRFTVESMQLQVWLKTVNCRQNYDAKRNCPAMVEELEQEYESLKLKVNDLREYL